MATYLQIHGGAPLDHPRRCTARTHSGAPCRRFAIRGGNVCPTHGGAAPQAKRKARERLEEAADRMAKQLLGIAESAESEAVKLAAVKHVLGIAGITEKTAVEVEHTVKPWEEVLDDITGLSPISRAESRAQRGIAAPTDAPNELTARPGRPYEHELNIVDAEVEEAPVPAPSSTGDARTPVELPPGSPPPFADPPAISGPRLQSEEDAMADIAATRRNARTVQVRRVRRR